MSLGDAHESDRHVVEWMRIIFSMVDRIARLAVAGKSYFVAGA
jgi:hypothetical protein